MNKCSLFFLLMLISSGFAFTQIELTKGKYQFNKIVEWPGQGSVLIAEDPTGATNDISLNLLNNEGAIPWSKTIYPKSKNPKLIISDHSNYFYYIDNFKPDNNFIHYNQVNQSGGIVSTKFDVLKVIRTYGYTTPNDLELNEIINTPSALVFYFQLPIKSEGIIENIFISITHHNNRVYHHKGPSTDIKLQKKGNVGPLLFAGANTQSIHFTYFSTDANKSIANFVGFSPKGEPIIDQLLRIPAANPIVSAFQSLNLDGSIYVENKTLFEARGKGVFLNNQYYFILNDAATNCLTIYGLNEKKEVVKLNKCEGNQASSRNPKATISYFEMDGDLYLTSEIEDSFSSNKIDKEGIQTLDLVKKDLENIQLNPSSFKTKDKTANFVHVINGTPFYTSTQEMDKQEKIIFKQ